MSEQVAMRWSEGCRAIFGTGLLLPIVLLLWGGPGAGWGDLDPRWVLLPLAVFWGAALVGWRSRGLPRQQVQRMLRIWRPIDPWCAALLIFWVLFRPPQSLWIPLAIFFGLAALILGLRRLSGPAWVATLFLFVMIFVILPRAFEEIILSRVAASYALDVDHRMKPDGRDINADGLRFRGSAESLTGDDFVVLFMGDSFTFGFNLPYEASLPYRFEALAEEGSCRARVRAVNMGWTSSSPLLGLRLLREVGYRYRPDLVIYSLDMTDFHDDIRYEWMLRERYDYEFDTQAVVGRWIATQWPWALFLRPAVLAVTAELRSAGENDREEMLSGLVVPRPDERFFISSYPLEETRPAIELGTMKHLAGIERLSRDVLGVPMALVIYPRAYQYSLREVPGNWELGYEPLGPYSREPFRYFAEVAPALEYPVIDLMPAFEASERFPLFFARDPHWNAAGAEVAAVATYSALIDLGLLPCSRTDSD